MKPYTRHLVIILMPILGSVSILLTACNSRLSSDSGNNLQPTTSSIQPASSQINSGNSPATSQIQAQGGGSGDAGGGNNDRPSNEDIRQAIEKLRSDTTWAWLPLQDQKYLDPSGKEHVGFTVSAGNSSSLVKLLTKMRDDMLMREDNSSEGHPSKQNLLQVELKDNGPCYGGDEKKEASAKYNDLVTPICLSLEYFKAMTPKATLEQSLKSLLMHEFSHQHGADEIMAKQVERYYDLPAVQKFKFVQSVSESFNSLRVTFKMLSESLQASMEPDSYPQSKQPLTNSQICELIKSGYDQALLLQNQVIQTDFVHDPPKNEDTLRLVLTNQVSGLKTFCSDRAGGSDDPFEVAPQNKTDLQSHLKEAIKTFDSLAQEFSKNSGVIIIDFSLHLWPYGSFGDQRKK